VNNEIYSIIIRSVDEENGAWLEAKCADNGYDSWKQLLDKYDRQDPIRAAQLRVELAHKHQETELCYINGRRNTYRRSDCSCYYYQWTSKVI